MKQLTTGLLLAGLIWASGCADPPRDYSTEHPTYYNDNTREEVRDTTEQILKNHYGQVRRADEFWLKTEPQIDKDLSRLLKEWAEAHIDEDGDIGLTIFVYEQISNSKTDFGEIDTNNPMWGAKSRDHTKEKELQREVGKRLLKERRNVDTEGP
jgi:hypothetical protein